MEARQFSCQSLLRTAQRRHAWLHYEGSLGEHAAVAEEKLKFTWRAPPDWMWRALAGYMRSMPVQDFQRVRAGELLVEEALVSADAAVAKR
jgi:hypothetical protein